jgi:signal transduction histidine kinase/CheY-like chemotaxis protein
LLDYLLNTDAFPRRWDCGEWTPALGYTHIVSDVLVWAAYMAIPLGIVYVMVKRPSVPFPRVFWLFGLFIFSCGTVHLVEAIIFYEPVYRLSALVKVVTAVASWGTVLVMLPALPKVLQFPDMEEMNEELAREVDQRRKEEESLKIARAQAEEANKAKSQFLANMSHELRTPLNAIIGFSELLIEDAEDDESPQRREDADKIRRSGKHLLGLINDVLDLSKFDAGQMQVFWEHVPLNELLEDVAVTVEPLMEENGNRFEQRYDTDLGTIETGSIKLRQCLINLLSNAAKFTSEGTVTLRVSEGTSNGIAYVDFEVTDTGIGMSPEQLEQVFEPFAQADESTTRDYGGTGLGLAITKRLCTLLNGKISVSSEPDAGTMFVMRFPKRRKPGSGAPARVITPLPTRRDRDHYGTVLVVDDDPNARELLTRVLTQQGYTVEVACGGEEGLEKARAMQPDAITLDIAMPDISGWKVLKLLKDDEETNDIPIILVTMSVDRDQAHSMGASDCLMKPVNRKKLIGILNKYDRRRDQGPVLIIEDDPDARHMISRIVGGHGWETVEAGDGEEGLAVARDRHPGLVLLDLMMPGMNGFAFCEEARERAEFDDIPIIVLTAHDPTEQETRYLREHADLVLRKDAASERALIRAIKKVLEHGEGRDA